MESALPALLMVMLFVTGLPGPDARLQARTGDVAGLHASRHADGWGIGYEWDAFADGSLNPADTSYAVVTAWAMEALLDSHAATDADMAAFAAYDARYWTGSGWWYSEHDPVDTANATAMFAGVAYRLGLRDHADAAMRHLAETGPPWPYSERGGVNDARHLGYICDGIRLYQEAGGSVSLNSASSISCKTSATSIRWHQNRPSTITTSASS